MAKTIKEERLRWVLPIVQKEIQLADAARVCPYSTRSLERWVAAYRRGGEAALEPKSTARKTQENETPIRIKEHIVELRKRTEALGKYGTPEIFNTDQGSQFTSLDFTQTLNEASVRISMDGKGRWKDNIMIERLWRTLKYECVYLNAFETGSEAREGIGRWVELYNRKRPHSSLDDRTPYEAYFTLPRAGYPAPGAA